MDKVFRLSGTVRHSQAVDEWLSSSPADLYAIAREWFEVMRQCGKLVTEIIHDGCPVACVGDVAFAYVNVFKAHINVGFYLGAFLDDPEKLLEGTGKRMRHIKLKPDIKPNKPYLKRLIKQSYTLAKSKS